MGLITRALIDSLQKTGTRLVTERVACPEWDTEERKNDGETEETGAFVYVKQLTCAQAEVYEKMSLENGRMVYGALAKTGQLSGTRAASLNLDEGMTVKEAADILDDPPSIRIPLVLATVCDEAGTCLFTDADEFWLTQEAPSLITRLHDAAFRLNTTGPEAVERAVKNFGTSQRNDSGIALPLNGAALFGSVSSS